MSKIEFTISVRDLGFARITRGYKLQVNLCELSFSTPTAEIYLAIPFDTNTKLSRFFKKMCLCAFSDG